MFTLDDIIIDEVTNIKINTKLDRMKELIDTLNGASDAYYNSTPIMSDYEFDRLYDELVQLESETLTVYTNSPTQNVGYEVKSALQKSTHSHPMLSLDKTKSVADLRKFAGKQDCIISLKLDGLTCLLTYEGGKLIKAETRGNGEVGEDITHNALVFDNVPKTIPYLGHFEIEGEAIILKHDFDKINSKLPNSEKYKNCRNLASGSVRQLSNKITAQRHVRFIAWKVPDEEVTFTCGFETAKSYGFEIVPYEYFIGEKNITSLKSKAEKLGIPIDGLVLTYNDVEYGKSLGMTGHHPRHSIAFKFYEDEEVSTLKDIEWTMGKTGVLTPVAVFDDVELNGTIVNRASLHNVSILKDLEIGIGDEITIYKANEIIPQIRDNLTKSNKYTIPNCCPYCGEQTIIIKDNDSEILKCSNNDCSGKLLGKLSHAVSRDALNIDSLSESTLKRFIKLGYVKSIKDIYHLFNHANKILYLSGFGQKSVDKLLDAIEKSRHIKLENFLYSLSVPLLGKTASKAFSKKCNGNFKTFIDIVNNGCKEFRSMDGIGDVIVSSLNNYWKINADKVIDLSNEFTFYAENHNIVKGSESNNLTGKTFVITGSVSKFKNRNEVKKYIENHGGKVTDSVTSKTSYLVNNDIESNSSKNMKAKKLNIPIITENKLLEIGGD